MSLAMTEPNYGSLRELVVEEEEEEEEEEGKDLEDIYTDLGIGFLLY